MRGSSCGARGAIACAVLCALSVAAAAQTTKRPDPPPAIDPYTRGEPDELARAGYVSFGPFRFGPQTTESVRSFLGDAPILWIETEHFRIGSTLEELKPEKPEEVKELERELAALRPYLDRLPTRARKLDPWLRLHLFARRLEELHADLRTRLAVLAPPPGAEAAKGQPAFGMRDKFLVLLTHKRSTLARFTREYCGVENGDVLLHFLPESGVLFFGVSQEAVDQGDSELHYAATYGVVRNLLCGIHGFARAPPEWWQHGLGLWFARAREPRVLLYSRPSIDALPPDELADWEPLVRGRVEGGACVPWSDMLTRASWMEQPFGDNVVLWSRIDFLMQSDGVAPRLAAALHAPGPQPVDGAAALQQATGLELDALDRAWSEWVVETYRKKRK